ncbi:MAG: hypothetical protein GY932_03000 [Arcobacter sp.]|nr:hypothetical protein [Arcobacter sp.]
MISEKEKYQNILNQLHELNRNIVLNENEKIEQLAERIDNLNNTFEDSSINTNENKFKKYYLSSLILSLINTLILILIIFYINDEKTVDSSTNKTNISESLYSDSFNSGQDVISLNKKGIPIIEENEEFVEMNPIIRKGTKYLCTADSNIYKIPYTVEIKGKLYDDRFKFILQENSITKECIIKKENM